VMLFQIHKNVIYKKKERKKQRKIEWND
jgi:hypothetical protein